MSRETIIGQNKTILVNSVFTVASGSTLDMGVFPGDKWSRVAGMFSVVGSFTFRYQMQSISGTTLVTSTLVVNSGGQILDAINYGEYIGLGFTQVVSSQPRVFLYGEPTR